MLHVLNGETTETLLAETAIPGERFSFRDALIAGPTPPLEGEEWRRVRAGYLSQAYDVDLEKCERDLARQEEVFKSFAGHDEVTLWFESDLFCQANLLYVLDTCARQNLTSTKLLLICIGDFPGRKDFRGLGELDPDELATLYPDRSPVSATQLDLAQQAWKAYRSADPRALEQFLQHDTSQLPFLKSALQLQLARYPSVRNGLNRIESKGLELINNGASLFADLFPRFSESEAGYGFGDAQLWNALQRLIKVRQPLLLSSNGVSSPERKFLPDAISRYTFSLTDTGKAVLNGSADAVSLNGIDEWLGGVHLQGHSNVWRWDEANNQLVKV
ncbi:MAG TPA: hypothetical protein VFR80_05445 [Pyrinomonadaceae bacterium]|nr:hypothetical protein [Pyrinomonadaceae bacterium]